MSWIAVLGTWLALFAIIFAQSTYGSPLTLVLSVVAIGGMQHRLNQLNHEASHHNLFESRQLNRWVGSLFAIFPFLNHPESNSYVLYRRIHLLHHRHAVSSKDPNYMNRKHTSQAGPMSPREICRHVLMSVLRGPVAFLFQRQHYVASEASRSLLQPRAMANWELLARRFKGDAELERERRCKLAFLALFAGAVFHFGLFEGLVLLWILPMLTVYQAICTVNDLVEHNWWLADENRTTCETTNSREIPRWLGFLFGYFNRNCHTEHHLFPRVPFFRLRRLSRILR